MSGFYNDEESVVDEIEDGQAHIGKAECYKVNCFSEQQKGESRPEERRLQPAEDIILLLEKLIF